MLSDYLKKDKVFDFKPFTPEENGTNLSKKRVKIRE